MPDRDLALWFAVAAFIGSTVYLQWAFFGLLRRLESMEAMLLAELKVRQSHDERVCESLLDIGSHIKEDLEKLTKPKPPIKKPDGYHIELFPDEESQWAFVIYRVDGTGYNDNWSAAPLDDGDHGQKFEWYPTAEGAIAVAVPLLEKIKQADAELYAKWAEEDKEEDAKWEDDK